MLYYYQVKGIETDEDKEMKKTIEAGDKLVSGGFDTYRVIGRNGDKVKVFRQWDKKNFTRQVKSEINGREFVELDGHSCYPVEA